MQDIDYFSKERLNNMLSNFVKLDDFEAPSEAKAIFKSLFHEFNTLRWGKREVKDYQVTKSKDLIEIKFWIGISSNLGSGSHFNFSYVLGRILDASTKTSDWKHLYFESNSGQCLATDKIKAIDKLNEIIENKRKDEKEIELEIAKEKGMELEKKVQEEIEKLEKCSEEEFIEGLKILRSSSLTDEEGVKLFARANRSGSIDDYKLAEEKFKKVKRKLTKAKEKFSHGHEKSLDKESSSLDKSIESIINYTNQQLEAIDKKYKKVLEENAAEEEFKELKIIAYQLHSEGMEHWEAGWELENKENHNADKKFHEAKKRFKEALELEPTDKMLKNAFEMSDLKIKGNHMLNKGKALYDKANELLATANKHDSAKDYWKAEAKYKQSISMLITSRENFLNCYEMSNDIRFKKSIDFIDMCLNEENIHLKSIVKETNSENNK